MSKIQTWIHELRASFQAKSGQTLVEYAFILVVISICCIIALQSIGTWVGSKFSTVSSSLQNAS